MTIWVFRFFAAGLVLALLVPSVASAQSTSQRLFDQYRRETGQYHPTDPRHPANRARTNRNQQLQQNQRTRQRYRPPARQSTTRQQPTGQKKPAGFDPKASANSWRERQRQRGAKTRNTGRPSGITTNQSRASGAGTAGRGGGIEAEGIDGIKMRGLTPKKQARKKQKYCRCRSDDWSQYGINCLPIQRAVRERIRTTPYPLGVYRWTKGCTSTAWK